MRNKSPPLRRLNKVRDYNISRKQHKIRKYKEIIKMFAELNTYRMTVKEGIDTQNMEFKALKEFCGHDFVVDGFFFSEGKFGKQVVVVGEGYLINMPNRAVEAFEKIEADKNMLQAVLDGHLGIKDIKMVDTKNGTTAAYTFYDC